MNTVLIQGAHPLDKCRNKVIARHVFIST